jgi:hypothetical protein
VKTNGFEKLIGTEIGSVAFDANGTAVWLHGTNGSIYRVTAVLSIEGGITTSPQCVQTCLPDPSYD